MPYQAHVVVRDTCHILPVYKISPTLHSKRRVSPSWAETAYHMFHDIAICPKSWESEVSCKLKSGDDWSSEMSVNLSLSHAKKSASLHDHEFFYAGLAGR